MEKLCHSSFLRNLWKKNEFLLPGEVSTSFIALYLSQMGHLALYWQLYHVPHSPSQPPGSPHLLCHYFTLPGCSGLHTSFLTAALPLHNWQGFSPPFVTHSVHKHQPCVEAMESLSQRLRLFFLSPTWETAMLSFHIYNHPSFHLWHGLVQWVHYAFT